MSKESHTTRPHELFKFLILTKVNQLATLRKTQKGEEMYVNYMEGVPNKRQ